jgi:4-diphosphocytidyl-2-C-methyl-D-erythritol kinase
MSEILEQARAKVNLALHVLGRRADGYHELSSVVAFADIGDQLRLRPAREDSLQVSGPFASAIPQDGSNMIWRAKAWLAERTALPAVSVTLEKNLPVAAGIGGGSSDAAAMLRALLKLIGHRLATDEVKALAKTLGADVPVCFHGQACRMEGIGEKSLPLDVKLPDAIVLVNPRLECSTVEVFRAMKLQPGQAHHGTGGEWRNDMMEAALQLQPRIKDVLEALGGLSLLRVSMSGSGATCFGLAADLPAAQAAATQLAAAHPAWWVAAARLG